MTQLMEAVSFGLHIIVGIVRCSTNYGQRVTAAHPFLAVAKVQLLLATLVRHLTVVHRLLAVPVFFLPTSRHIHLSYFYELNLGQRLGNIGNQITGIFDADADPKEIMPVVVVVDKNQTFVMPEADGMHKYL